MRSEIPSSEAPPNNGMHPTRISVDVIRQLEGLFSRVRAGDAGRYASSLWKAKLRYE